MVASELRALAQRVTGAAREVRTLIGESAQRVEGGAKLVGGLGGTLEELVGRFRMAGDRAQVPVHTTEARADGP